MSQNGYPLTQSLGLVGQLADIDPDVRCIARTYAKRKHTITVNLGATTDGTYTIRVTAPADVVPPENPVSGSFVASISTADQIVQGLADDLNVQVETINGVSRPALRNLALVAADLPGDNVVITGVRAGEVFVVDFPSNPGGNLTQSTTVDGSPATIPYGIAAVFDGDDEARLPTTGDAAADIAGVLKRGKQIEAPDDNSAETHDDGATLEIVARGRVFVMPEVDVAVGDAVYARVTATGSEQAGAFRNDADGGDAVQLTNYRWLRSGGPTTGEPAVLAVNAP